MPPPPAANDALRYRLLRRLGVELRPEESAVAGALFLALFLMVAFQYTAKSVRQSTFIDALGAANLPWVYLLVALTSWPLLRLYMGLADRIPRQRLIALTCLVVAASMVPFWWLLGTGWSWVPILYYLWVTIVFVATVSQFWSFASHVLDARQARRLFGLIGAGGLLGGVAGGQIARLATGTIGTRGSLLVAGVILATAVLLLRTAWRRAPRAAEGAGTIASVAGPDRRGHDPAATGMFSLLRTSKHLRLIALVMALGVMVGQVIDLQFNAAVEQATSTLEERTAWFGNFFSLLSLVAFGVQILFTSRIHTALGVGVALRILPLVAGAGTVAVLFSSVMLPEMAAMLIMALKIGDGGVRLSIDQSTRELLFLPIRAEERVKAKAIIDVLIQRAAKGGAALLLLPVTFGLLSAVGAGWITLALTAAWLAAAGAAYTVYVRAFRSGLKQRTMDTVVPISLSDVRTVELLVESLGSADSRQVLHSLEILGANGRGNLVPPLLLYHDDPEVRHRTLRILAEVGRTDAATLVARRLGDDSPDVRAEAIRVLTAFQGESSCALMLPRLREADPKVRAAAVTCLINFGGEDDRAAARRTLADMLSDAAPGPRAEAIKAIGSLDAGRASDFDARLLCALDDADPIVAREAIHAVRRVVERSGFKAHFLPRLISLLQNRRLKLDAREAIVSFGAGAVPILVHFMNEQEESILVRRALPRTLARIGGETAVAALVSSLAASEDGFLRAQVIEALTQHREKIQDDGRRAAIEAAIERETRHYLRRLADIHALDAEGGAHFEGPLARIDRRELNLLTQMLCERLEDHVRMIFGLLALLYPPQDIWAAWRSLVSGRRLLLTHALEYLDNTTTGSVRRNVFAVIDDKPVGEKLCTPAAKALGIEPGSREHAVGRLLEDGLGGNVDARALSVAALYTVYTDRLDSLYPKVEALGGQAGDPLLQETAAWVAGKLHRSVPRPAAG